MPDFNALRVRDLLKALGDTPDAVAESLHRLGITGRPASDCGCPIARYVSGHLGGAPVVVMNDMVYPGEGFDAYMTIETADRPYALLPYACSDFVGEFDEGLHPELIED